MAEVDADQQTPQQQPGEVETQPPSEEEIAAARKKSKGLEDLYSDGARESAVLPGSDGTISGTAIAGWLDDNGDIKPVDER